jgi:hypothetical protein
LVIGAALPVSAFASRSGLMLGSVAPKRKARLLAGLRLTSAFRGKSGAGEGARTLDPDLGKVVLYH